MAGNKSLFTRLETAVARDVVAPTHVRLGTRGQLHDIMTIGDDVGPSRVQQLRHNPWSLMRIVLRASYNILELAWSALVHPDKAHLLHGQNR